MIAKTSYERSSNFSITSTNRRKKNLTRRVISVTSESDHRLDLKQRKREAHVERTIKRYRNRKMYDTSQKVYINFSDIERMIRENEPVKVIDNVTGEDITRQILVQLLMRSEPRQSDSRVPLDGLKNMLQTNESPIFQAFRNVLNIGRDVVQQFSTRITPETDRPDQQARFIPDVAVMVKNVFEKVSESTVKVIDGTLARELLSVPKKNDWNRIEKKLELLETRLVLLRDRGTEGENDVGKENQ